MLVLLASSVSFRHIGHRLLECILFSFNFDWLKGIVELCIAFYVKLLLSISDEMLVLNNFQIFAKVGLISFRAFLSKHYFNSFNQDFLKPKVCEKY